MTQSSGTPLLRIGTRGSPLALLQAEEVRTRLVEAHACAPSDIEICPIRTSGDKIQDRPLAEAGGKGLFTKEIEDALLAGRIDIAVHSAKDVPTWLPDGLLLIATLTREDVRDVFISPHAQTIAALAPGAVVGTASLRRQAMVMKLRPDLKVVSFRGNVQTRLRKLEEGEVHATLLALAGLNRLGCADVATEVLSVDDFLPAVGQGALTIEAGAGNTRIHDLLACINDPDADTALTAERAFLAALDGSCRTPIAGHARVDGDHVRFRGMILRPDGSESHENERAGSRVDAAAMGADAGAELKGRAPPDFFHQH
jgi:hydroxymethylbilane synthase